MGWILLKVKSFFPFDRQDHLVELSFAAIVISILGMILGAVLPIILYSRGGVFDNLLGLYS